MVPDPCVVREPVLEMAPERVKMLPLESMAPLVVRVIGLERVRAAAPDWRMFPLLVLNVRAPVPRAVLAPTERVPCWKMVPPL